VRTIVVDGAGPAFSAGHDLSEMVGRDLAFYQRLFDLCTVLMETIPRVPRPVIAKVHGVATAAGCQLVAACDLAVAADDARFATPGVRIGLFCSTPMVPLSRSIGRKRALEMLLTGEPIDAATALEWGLVNRVVPAAGLDGAVTELAEKIGRSSALTVGIGKEAFYEQIELDEHRARPGDAVMRLEELGRVQGQVGDAVAVLDPELLERGGEPAGSLAELRPRQPAILVDDRSPLGEHRRRPLEEGDRRQRREMDRVGDGVPYIAS